MGDLAIFHSILGLGPLFGLVLAYICRKDLFLSGFILAFSGTWTYWVYIGRLDLFLPAHVSGTARFYTYSPPTAILRILAFFPLVALIKDQLWNRRALFLIPIGMISLLHFDLVFLEKLVWIWLALECCIFEKKILSERFFRFLILLLFISFLIGSTQFVGIMRDVGSSVEAMNGQVLYLQKSSGLFGSYLGLGLFCAFLPLVLVQYLSRISYWAIGGVLMSSYLCIVFSQSRISFLTFIVICLGLLILRKIQIKHLLPLFCLVIAIEAYYFAAINKEGVQIQRFNIVQRVPIVHHRRMIPFYQMFLADNHRVDQFTGHDLQENSFKDRLSQYFGFQRTVQRTLSSVSQEGSFLQRYLDLKAHPIFRLYFGVRENDYRITDSSYLYILHNFGVIGLISFLCFLLACLKKMRFAPSLLTFGYFLVLGLVTNFWVYAYFLLILPIVFHAYKEILPKHFAWGRLWGQNAESSR